MKGVLAVLLLCLAIPAWAENEDYHNTKWCAERGGQTEVVLYDRSRVDCLLPDFAVETDFAYKWAESVGQSLLYAELTGKKPAVLLIVRPGDAYLVARWHNAADGLGIRLFTIDYEE